MKQFFSLFFLGFSFFTFAQSNSLIDAAFAWDKDIVFFTRNNTVVKFNNTDNKVLKTSTIAEAFPGVTFTKIDAALDYGNGNVYFFSDNQYTRFNKKNNWADNGYPKDVNAKTWPGITFKPIEAALYWPNDKCFFFSQSEYIRYNRTNEKADENYPKNIDNTTWPGVPFSKIDAALLLPNGKAYLFNNEEYVRFDIEEDKVDTGYPKDMRFWPGLKDALLHGGDHPDRFNYEKFIVKTEVDGKTIYDVKQEGIDLLFSTELKTVPYTDFDKNEYKLYPWYGKNIVYLTEKKDLNLKAMYLVIAFTDMGWTKFKALVGDKNPSVYKEYLLNGRSTFAILKQSSCGSGCGQVGFNGIEITNKIWSYHKLAKDLKAGTPLQIGFLPFYEMGRNFAIFNKVLKIDDKKYDFNSGSLMAETTKSLNYPYAAAEAGIPISNDGTLDYHGKRAIEDLSTYLADKSKNSKNTLLQKQDHKGDASYKLMRSFLFYIAQNYGGYDCVTRMWSAAHHLEKPNTPQDVLDNYFLIACFGAQTDLTNLFEKNFKYFLSDKVKQYAEVYAKDNFKF